MAVECRSKRRKHSAEVDTVVSLLSKLSTLSVARSTSDSVALSSSSDMNVELSGEVVTRLHELLTVPCAHSTRLSVDLSTLNSTLQVCFSSLLVSCRSFVCLFFSGRSPAYSGLQHVGRQQAQCACPWERGELVGVCSVCSTCGRGGISRCEQLVRYLLMRPVKAWLTV